MKFRLLLVGLLVVFSSVGSYAQDYISFDITSVTLTENNWDDGGDNSAELMIMAISESYSGKRTQLTIPAEGSSISASLNSRISLEEYSGLHIPIGKDIVRVYLFAFDADQINSVLGIAGGAFVKLTAKMIAQDAWKYVKNFKKSNFYSFVAGEAVGYGFEEAKKYIEENDDLGRAVVEIHKKTISDDIGVVYGVNKGVKFTYKIKLERGDSDDNSYSSSPPSNSSTKWITPKPRVCRNYGGTIAEDSNAKDEDICEANWQNAKKICIASGGYLPSIDKLKKAVIDCGGIPTDEFFNETYYKNKANNSYMLCFLSKGFMYYSCWSSTTVINDTEQAWTIDFLDATIDNASKSNNKLLVHCVRQGQ